MRRNRKGGANGRNSLSIDERGIGVGDLMSYPDRGAGCSGRSTKGRDCMESARGRSP